MDDVDWRWKVTDKSYRKFDFLSAQNNEVMEEKEMNWELEVASQAAQARLLGSGHS